MEQQESIYVLKDIRKRYIRKKVLLYAMQATSPLILGGVLLYRWETEITALAIIAVSLILLSIVYFTWSCHRINKTTLQQVASHLNRKYPVLEDSSALLLRSADSLNLLERLQQQRVATRLSEIIQEEKEVYKLKPAFTLTALCIALVFSAGILYLPAAPLAGLAESKAMQINFPDKSTSTPDTVAVVTRIEILVTPPAYTGKKPYRPENLSIKIEEGARVTWAITTSRPATEIKLVLNETSEIPLSNLGTTYSTTKTFAEPALYHINLNGEKSAYYTIEVIPDNAPTIQIVKPEQYTEVLFGQPQKVLLQASLSDEYGIRDANMIATVAKGTGEAVKFREEKISLGFKGPSRSFDATKTLDLKQLNMTYGDELYFYIQAWDNNKGYTRSETFFVQIEDTTIVESMDDMALGVNPVPEYFRSQRQIIIDTEKLIAEKGRISKAAFEERANNIGVDQKLLRLRYGKFLGEEFESGIGPGGGIPEGEEHHENDGHDHGTEFESSNSAAALLDPYLHKHDQEEAATFFEPAVKSKLKGALAQMWEAELRLRTHKPKEALPFEYKALRLLKEVQQSTRAYAAKTGFEAPPLKEPEKRLTGDLSKVKVPSERRQVETKTVLPDTKAALKWLVKQKQQGVSYQKNDVILLERAGQELAQQALEKPGKYFKAMQDLRTLISNVKDGEKLCFTCLLTVERAWHELLPPAPLTPQQQTARRGKLSEQYLKALKSE